MSISSWSGDVVDQLTWHWENQARPRLEGLGDQEYLWEPVPGMWSVRPRGHGVAEEIGAGDFVIDFAFPVPEPAPVTTIAWRLSHVIVGVFGERNARYFGGPEITYDSFDYPGTAGQALHQLDQGYRCWIEGVGGIGDAGMTELCREAGFETASMLRLVLHIHREVIHHLAEVALLRDLYQARA